MNKSTPYLISIPRFRIERKKALVGMAGLVAIGVALFWFFAIYPYVWIDGGHIIARKVFIAADSEGKVVEIKAREGERVKKGDLLFSLDTELLDFKLEQLNAQQRLLEDQIRFNERESQQTMQEYLGAVQRSELGLEADDAVRRLFSLLEEAQKRCAEDKEMYKRLEAEKSLQILQKEKKKSVAPFDGIVTRVWMDVGSVAGFGQPALSLYDPSSLVVEIPLQEKYFRSVSLGSSVLVQLEAFPGKDWVGEVVSILPEQEGEGPVFRVRVEGDLPWIPGFSARVRLKR